MSQLVARALEDMFLLAARDSVEQHTPRETTPETPEQRSARLRALFRQRKDERNAASCAAATQQAAEAARNAPPPAPSGRTRVRSPEALQLILSGSRAPREKPLIHDDLWIGEARPPNLVTDREHQTCGICGFVKSQPVSYVVLVNFMRTTDLEYLDMSADIAIAMCVSACGWRKAIHAQSALHLCVAHHSATTPKSRV